MEKEVPVIEKLIAQNNSYTVIASGSKKILYSAAVSYTHLDVYKRQELVILL